MKEMIQLTSEPTKNTVLTQIMKNHVALTINPCKQRIYIFQSIVIDHIFPIMYINFNMNYQ